MDILKIIRNLRYIKQFNKIHGFDKDKGTQQKHLIIDEDE